MKKYIALSILRTIVLVEVGVLILVFFLYLLSSPQTLKYAIDRATQKLDIQYDNISGNFLKTISLTNLKYKNKLLANEATLDWNIRALIQGEMEIETLSLKNVDIANIEAFVQSLQTESSSDSSTFPQINVAYLHLSTLPYKSKYITINNFNLNLYEVNSDLEDFSIEAFKLETTNDHINIRTNGTFKNATLHLENLALQEINIPKIEKSFAMLQEENNNSQSEIFVKEIKIDNLIAYIKPYNYKNYNINNLVLKANNVNALVDENIFDAKDISFKGNTNAGKIDIKGSLHKNDFEGTSTLHLSQKYFQEFTSIIDFESLNPINLHILATPDTVNARINLQSKQIFSGRYKKYFTAINSLESNVTYEIKSGKFQAITDANVSSKYASSLILKDTLTYDTNLSYGGSIDITGVGYFPELMLPLFKDAKLYYQGDSKDLVANLQTDKLHLLYKMYDFERADFHLTSKDLNYTDYDPTPAKILTPLVASLSATMSLDFDKTDTLLLDTNITSNAVNIVGKTTIYDGKASTKSTTTLSENSYLKELHKDVKYTDIFPAALDIGYHDSRISLDLVGKNPLLKNSFLYDLNSSYLKESLTLGSDTFTLEGDNTRLNFSTHTYSLKTLQESLMPFYTFNKEPYDGEVEINATIENFSIIDADIKSKWLVYEYSLNKFAFVEKLKMQVHSDNNKTILKNYRFNTYMDYDRQFYATKPSTILYQDNRLTITTLWVNDALHTKGGYDLTKHQGIFYTTAQEYRYNGQEGDITFNTNIKTTFANKKTHIEGNIDILKGLIRYEHRNKHDIQDPDIIIIQEEEAQRLREQEKKVTFL